ncbi:MAG: hypothetical protein OCD01_10160 [Fibrobacterales bacterium]
MNKLDETLRNHYADHSLSEVAVNRILAKGKRAYRKKQLFRIAALFILSTSLLVGITQYRYESSMSRTVAEIKMNHLKGEQPTIKTDNYRALSTHLNELAFAIPQSKRLRDYSLIGGLYCSVQGNRAAQLKLNSPSGSTVTLYVTQAKGTLESLTDDTVKDENITVSVWQEGPLFFGLAQGP